MPIGRHKNKYNNKSNKEWVFNTDYYDFILVDVHKRVRQDEIDKTAFFLIIIETFRISGTIRQIRINLQRKRKWISPLFAFRPKSWWRKRCLLISAEDSQ
jgi:hypothetical protein